MDELPSDRFHARQLIGRGAAADVYRAHDAVLDRPVAVKVFRPGHDDMALRRFREETRTLAGLSHPGLVTVFSCGVDEDRPYLVMRLVEGETLQSLLLGGPLSPTRTARLGALLADTLAYVHRHRIVHRDVKPSNILLDAEGVPFLGDFGIALTAEGTRMTRTNEIIGTPAYLAPEQVLGEDVGPAADVYALGLTLLECLTGVTEYRAGSEVATAIARLHRSPRLPDDLPPRLTALLGAMTSTDPRDRPTAAQCATRLRTPAMATSIKRSAPNSPRPLRIRPVPTAAAAFAAVVIGLVLIPATAPAMAQPQATRAADNAPVLTPSTTRPPIPTRIPTSTAGPAAGGSPAVVAVVHPSVDPPAHHPGHGRHGHDLLLGPFHLPMPRIGHRDGPGPKGP